ncbi:hypothetical protein AgCh_024713 [Apium graveolens]
MPALLHLNSQQHSVSHSNIFSTTKFWFLVSNIIILIIAADFGAFHSSIKDDLYKDYPKHDHYQYQLQNDQRRSLSHLKSQTPKIVESVYPDQANEQVKDIVVYKVTKSSKYEMENYDIVARNDEGNKRITNFGGGDIIHQLDSKVDQKDRKHDEEKGEALPCRHLSMSDGDAAAALNDLNEKKKMNVLYRSKTENFDANTEDHEFSSMSNEELNKRVEEFIKRCHRQIRLEAVTRRFQQV